jgi:hypothetical protein
MRLSLYPGTPSGASGRKDARTQISNHTLFVKFSLEAHLEELLEYAGRAVLPLIGRCREIKHHP